MKSPTLRDIADEAGVHFTTVGVALRGNSRIRPETRDRILEIAKRMGYRPNPMVSALMANVRTGRHTSQPVTIAFCTYWTQGGNEGWKNFRSHRLFYEGAKARAEEMGYKIVHFNLAEGDIRPERWSQILYTRNIQGIILASFEQIVPELQFEWENFATVRIDNNPQAPHFDSVSTNQIELVRVGFRKAVERGYRRIGICVNALWDQRLGDQFLSGFLTEQARLAPEHRVEPFISFDYSFEAFASWFKKEQPDALLAMPDQLVRGWLERPELGVNQPFGYVSMDLTEPGDEIAGARKNHALLGEAAVSMLIDKLQRSELGIPEYPRLTLVEAKWNDGKSLSPCLQPRSIA